MGSRLPAQFGHIGRSLWRGIAVSSSAMVFEIGGNHTRASTSAFNTLHNSTSRRSGMALSTYYRLQDQRAQMGISSQSVRINDPSWFLSHTVTLPHRPPADIYAASDDADAGRGRSDEAYRRDHHKILATQGPQDCIFCGQEVHPYGSRSPVGARANC